MAEPSSKREIIAKEEQQLKFMLNAGIVKDYELSM